MRYGQELGDRVPFKLFNQNLMAVILILIPWSCNQNYPHTITAEIGSCLTKQLIEFGPELDQATLKIDVSSPSDKRHEAGACQWNGHCGYA